MFNMSRRGLAALTIALSIAAIGTTSSPAHAQQKPVIKVSSLTLPVFNPLVWNIMKARGFDAKNGFELDAKAYPSISAFYAAFATGETDVLIGGPTILQKLYQEGVPVRIIGTGFTLADLVIFTKNDKIKSLADLKGKQLAVDMGGSQFQVTKMYAAAKGLDLGRDIIVVNANFAVARAQLEADRVDAALVIEPLASIIIKQNPDWKVIFNGAEGWKEITGQDGWEIVTAMRADAIAKFPDAPKKLIAALQDVAKFIKTDTAEADKIANETLKLPPGILTAALESNRLQMVIQPAWEPATRKSITDMMERAVKAVSTKNAGRKDYLCTLSASARRSDDSGVSRVCTGSDLSAADFRLSSRVRACLGSAVVPGALSRDSAIRDSELSPHRKKHRDHHSG